ncbi:MAG: FGGY family carbohydrate kinase, partial [Castellaniella sp.]|uniref:FGGY family carbohydrate kinase n=1 Tax=Castellaniella sp. TaxID=1955812 RepID=UPI003C73272C
MHQAPSSLSSRNDTVLAVDLGGTRFRAALVDDKGDIVQTCVIDSPSCRTTQPGWDEIDPDAWWRGLCTLCDT